MTKQKVIESSPAMAFFHAHYSQKIKVHPIFNEVICALPNVKIRIQ